MESSENKKRRLLHILSQYDQRIAAVLRGRKHSDLNTIEQMICDQLVRFQLYDPRRPDVGFGSEETLRKSLETAARLAELSDEEFQKSEYVLTWMYELDDAFKVTNLPFLNDASTPFNDEEI